MKIDQEKSLSTPGQGTWIKFVLIIGGLALAFAIGLGLRFWLREKPAQAQTDALRAAVFQGAEKVAEQTVAGVRVSAGNFRRQGGLFYADVCFDLPDAEDWDIEEASLAFGGQTIGEFGFSLIERREPTGSQKGVRCDTVYFELGPKAEVGEFTLSIDAIAAPAREGQTCDPSYLEGFQKALDARNTGITIKCELVDLNGGGMEGLAVADKPASMSLEEAEALVNSRELFMEVRGRKGPWVFSGSLP
jgi:hypothetical protein